MWRCPKDCLPRGIHISPLGVIPKKNKPGKWRLIVDLSALQGGIINDGIDSELSSLSCSSIDHLAALVVSEGRGSLLRRVHTMKVMRIGSELIRIVCVHTDCALTAIRIGCVFSQSTSIGGLKPV